nr:hypothetical protein [Collinsella vaginalis]
MRDLEVRRRGFAFGHSDSSSISRGSSSLHMKGRKPPSGSPSSRIARARPFISSSGPSRTVPSVVVIRRRGSSFLPRPPVNTSIEALSS